MENKFNTVFIGTAPFGFPVMRALDEHSDVLVKCVITQPDREKGRGRENKTPPVGNFARELDLPLYQPENINKDGKEIFEELGEINLGIVVAYGQLLSRGLFSYPDCGTYNFHASLLPRWRGAAPIRHTLLAGDEYTGVTVFELQKGMDTGPICQQVKTRIRSGENYGQLYERLSKLNVGALELLLADLSENSLECKKQEGDPTYASMIKGDDARIDWKQPAEAVQRHIRAFSPDPGAFTFVNGERFKVYRVRLIRESGPAGEFLGEDERLIVGCEKNALQLLEVQPAGSRRMEGHDFLAGQQEINISEQ